ncbi:Putative acyl-CoA N-acyltransferase [Nitrosotalea devaniterrae]|uniref:Acyl-CoA N-acyltransferase n=1 Tax=Nitrosotalea devaniterrae TaxID=1078905 RepID=A0A128A0V5_9ARCH|nr:Putative acyl-CoA N-acyltransferase [Candidatus Nitrosotalea devanaterra]
MNFSLELKNEPPQDWNKHLLSNTTGNIFNSVEYSEYARKWLKWNPIFCRVFDSSGNILLQTLLFEYISNVKRVPHFLHGVVRKLKNSIRWNYGPITSSQECSTFFLSHIKQNYKKVYGTTHPLSNLEYTYFNKTLWSTFLIDLTKSKEELYGGMSKHNARKNIERSIERNVIVEEITDKTLDEYSSLLDKHRSSMNLSSGNAQEFHDMWKFLHNAGFSGFLARKDGISIGGLLFSFFNNYINEWGVARSQQDTEEKLYAQDLIKWKIIEWGIDHKMKWYDLSGVNPIPKSKKEEGILEYKKKWGGIQKNYWIMSS